MNANATNEPVVPQARYDHYHIYNVELATAEHVELFQKLEEQSDSLMFMGPARKIGQKLTILLASHRVADIADLLETYKINFRILTRNFQTKIDENFAAVLPIGTDPKLFDWKHYFHLETIYEWMSSMVEKHGDVLTLLDMGNSTQGVPIKGVKLAHNPKNKTIFIESGIHAREWIAPATATYILNTLLSSKDAGIKALATQYNWIIFPSINPDGYKYTFEHDRMWRKNRQLFAISRGVDLNRNYPNNWNSIGCSSDPSRYHYCGPSAASEVETQRLVDFMKANVEKEQIKSYIALHSFSQILMFPQSHNKERVPNYDDLKEFSQKAADCIKALSGRTYTNGCSTDTIYPTSGGSTGWAYSVMGIPVAFTFELRGPPDSADLFILPADEIEDAAAEAFAAMKTIVECAAEKDYYK